jgi:hypothetical protein
VFVQSVFDPLGSDVATFLGALATSSYWSTAVSEYGIGSATLDVVSVPDALLGSDDEVPSYLQSHLSPLAAGWPAPDTNTVYLVPIDDTDCSVNAGFHSEVTIGAGKATYAVVRRCAGFLTALDTLSFVTSHELAESATDPFPFSAPAYSSVSDAAWEDFNNGGEVGDMCENSPADFIEPGTGHPVPRIWSNAQAAAGHDPCVPQPSGDVFFGAAPALPDMLGSDAFGVATRGLQIANDGQRTIDVTLFSDAATDDITVFAVQLGNGPDLALSFDRTSGRNGDVLHLTVGVGPPTGVIAGSNTVPVRSELFEIVAQLGDLQQSWPVAVGN